MGLEQVKVLPPHGEIPHPEISEILVFPTPDEAAKAAASEILETTQAHPRARITYATGETMVPVYSALAKEARETGVDFSKSTAFQLDEYYPCNPEEPHSFVGYLRERVFDTLKIGVANEIDGLAEVPGEEAARYDRLLSQKPIDLAILGIGPWSSESQTGGHIAFNEPGTPFSKRTHVAHLDEVTTTRDQKERGQKTPGRAITQGIGNILEARKILLVAYGKNKGDSLREALYGEIGEQRPASSLRTVGEKVKIYLDETAAAQLRSS